MNKEEIEELKDFTIDLTDIDELALGLEVCSKKSNMVIQEFANLIIELEQQNKKYKEQLLVAQTNEETFRLEMEDITQTLGLDEDILFDDVKAYARSLKDNWNKLKEYIRKNIIYDDVGMKILDPSSLEDYIQELEQGSDSNEI